MDVVGATVLTLGLALMFLPSIIALTRRLPDLESVVALNVFVLPWAFAFSLAVRRKEPLDKNYPSTPGERAWRWRAIGGLVGGMALFGLCLAGTHGGEAALGCLFAPPVGGALGFAFGQVAVWGARVMKRSKQR